MAKFINKQGISTVITSRNGLVTGKKTLRMRVK